MCPPFKSTAETPVDSSVFVYFRWAHGAAKQTLERPSELQRWIKKVSNNIFFIIIKYNWGLFSSFWGALGNPFNNVTGFL